MASCLIRRDDDFRVELPQPPAEVVCVVGLVGQHVSRRGDVAEQGFDNFYGFSLFLLLRSLQIRRDRPYARQSRCWIRHQLGEPLMITRFFRSASRGSGIALAVMVVTTMPIRQYDANAIAQSDLSQKLAATRIISHATPATGETSATITKVSFGVVPSGIHHFPPSS